MIKMKRVLPILALVVLLGCTKTPRDITFIATIHPAAEIIREIAGKDVLVKTMLPKGSSPHTYTPKPSDIAAVYNSSALIYVSDDLDGWAANIQSQNKIRLIDYIPDSLIVHFQDESPGHNHNEHITGRDPHFWTDPMVIKSLVPTLVEQLSKLNSGNREKYEANASKFIAKLDSLDNIVKLKIKAIEGKPVFLFHPSLLYFMKRYNLTYAGSIEPAPGKESSPRFISELAERIKASGAKAIFSEPQLPDKPAKLLAEEAGVNYYLLDPIGGGPGRESIFELINYNADILIKALQ